MSTHPIPILLGMPARRRASKKDHKQLLDIIHKGKLFALQEWIKSGNPLRPPETLPRATRILCASVRTGFHTMVEELLGAGPWPPREMADALDWARSHRRYDIAELLLNHGAEAKQQDFETVCEVLDLPMMERHLRNGTDPNQDNVFARVLCSAKARPLLGFYRQFGAEFPALHDQAALALSEAVKNNEVRWTALLVWAGADPLRPTPYDLDGSFPVDPEGATTAATQAICRHNPEILKVLRLNPEGPQAVTLLHDAASEGLLELFQTLIHKVSPDQLNNTDRASCKALEALVGRSGRRLPWDKTPDEERDTKALQCVELLLDAGACWNPSVDGLRSTRRSIMEHDARYIVQLFRLLLYTPDAANIERFLELCRSQTLIGKLGAADLQLVREIKQLRKTQLPVTTSSPKTSMVSTYAPEPAGAQVT